MKNKGIAIRTILLLVVGILVVGIIVYFTYRYLTRSPGLTESQCRARIISYCTGCYNGGFTGGPQMGSLFTDCEQYGLLGCATTTRCGGTCGTGISVKSVCSGFIPTD